MVEFYLRPPFAGYGERDDFAGDSSRDEAPETVAPPPAAEAAGFSARDRAAARAAAKTVLLCSPEHFNVHFALNPWVDLDKKVDKANARRQWELLRDTYERLGIDVRVIPGREKLYDMVFAGDSVFVHGRRVVQSRFRHPERRPEAPIVGAWFAARGFEVIPQPDEDPYFFEGTGETLRWRGRIFSGWGVRNSLEGVQFAAKAIRHDITPLRIVDKRFFHLDTCLFFVSDDLILWYPPAFDDESRAILESLDAERVPVPEHEAAHFACNSVAVGRTVVMNRRCPETKRLLQKRGFDIVSLPVREFLKAGGGLKCLTLMFDWPKDLPKDDPPAPATE